MPWLKYFSVIIATTIKFLGGPVAGVTLGLSWLETAICSTIGMMLTVTLTLLVGKYIVMLLFSKSKLFSKRTRFAVKIWKGFGIKGIAFLTPLIFTPIGGTFIALSFNVNKFKILIWMLISAALWGVVQSILLFQIPFLRGLFN